MGKYPFEQGNWPEMHGDTSSLSEEELAELDALDRKRKREQILSICFVPLMIALYYGYSIFTTVQNRFDPTLAGEDVHARALASDVYVQGHFLDRHDLLDWLAARDFAKLETELSQLQRTNKTGGRTDVQLEHALETFIHSTPKTLIALDDWVAAYPESAFAYAARGLHYRNQAWRHRGGGTSMLKHRAYDLPVPEQVIDTSNAYQYALEDLVASVEHDPSLSVPYAFLIELMMMRGAEDQIDDLYTIGMQEAPYGASIRWRYFSAQRPQWGGSMATAKIAWTNGLAEADAMPVAPPPEGVLTYLDAERHKLNKDKETARAMLEQINTSTARSWYGVSAAKLAEQMGDYEGAIVLIEDALTRYPQNPMALNVLGESLCRLDRFERALDVMEASLRLDPLDPQALRNKAWCNRRLAGTMEDGSPEAMAHYETALTATTENMAYEGLVAFNRYQRAYTLTHKLDRPAEALDDARFSVRAYPSRSRYLNTYAETLFRMHDCEFEDVDRKLLRVCQRKSCSDWQIDRAEWRLQSSQVHGWCSARR